MRTSLIAGVVGQLSDAPDCRAVIVPQWADRLQRLYFRNLFLSAESDRQVVTGYCAETAPLLAATPTKCAGSMGRGTPAGDLAVYHRSTSQFTFTSFAKSIFLFDFVSLQLSALSPCSEKRKGLTGCNGADIVVKSGKKWV